MKGRAWTSAENERLADLLASGLDWPAVAARIGRTAAGCRRHASNVGLRVTFTRDPKRNGPAIAACWTPERRAKAAQILRERKPWVKGLEVIAATRDTVRPRKSAKLIAAKAEWWSWCPPEFRDDYRRLARIMPATEAKATVLRDMATAHARDRARMTPFERQLAAIQAGTATVWERPLLAPQMDGRA